MAQTVQIDEMPQKVEQFASLHDQLASTPEGGAAMMVVALLVYAGDAELGRQCLSVAVDPEQVEEGPDGYLGRRMRRRESNLIRLQLAKQSYLPRSYVQGTTPQNGYELPALPYIIEFSRNPYSGDEASGRCKVFVNCSGASTPRPVTVKRSPQGTWKASEWSTLVVGIAKAVEQGA